MRTSIQTNQLTTTICPRFQVLQVSIQLLPVSEEVVVVVVVVVAAAGGAGGGLGGEEEAEVVIVVVRPVRVEDAGDFAILALPAAVAVVDGGVVVAPVAVVVTALEEEEGEEEEEFLTPSAESLEHITLSLTERTPGLPWHSNCLHF